MTEFVGLRVRKCTLRVQGKKDTKKAKSVKSNVVARAIIFKDYSILERRNRNIVAVVH